MTPRNQESSHQPGRADWPVFILSCHRSGSTLLRYLLDSHERLACPPESKFIPALQGIFDFPQSLMALRTLGLTSDDVALEVRLFVERVMRRYTRSVNKRRWVDKTPNHYLHTELLERIFRKQVLYVVLARHPLDCITSLEGFFPPYSQAEDAEVARNAVLHGHGRYAWIRYWVDVYSRLTLFAASTPERCLVVTYEDLVYSPHQVLQDICTFIRETYDPEMVTRAFSTTHVRGFGDVKIDRTNGIHDASIGKWLSWPSPEAEAAWNLVRDQATKFGYMADSALPTTTYRLRRDSQIEQPLNGALPDSGLPGPEH